LKVSLRSHSDSLPILLKNGLEEFTFGLIHLLCSFIVADGEGDCIQLIKGEILLEERGCLGQGLELVIRCFHFLVGIAFFHLALAVNVRNRKETGTVEVDLGIKVLPVEIAAP